MITKKRIFVLDLRSIITTMSYNAFLRHLSSLDFDLLSSLPIFFEPNRQQLSGLKTYTYTPVSVICLDRPGKISGAKMAWNGCFLLWNHVWIFFPFSVYFFRWDWFRIVFFKMEYLIWHPFGCNLVDLVVIRVKIGEQVFFALFLDDWHRSVLMYCFNITKLPLPTSQLN